MYYKTAAGAVCALYLAALLAGCSGGASGTASGSSQVLGQITAITETSITLNLAETSGTGGQRPDANSASRPEGTPPQNGDNAQGEPPVGSEGRPSAPQNEDGQPAQRGGEAFGEPTLTGESQTIILTSSTKYTLAGSGAIYSDFETGDWVRVEIKDLVAVSVTGLEMPTQPGESPAPGGDASDEAASDEAASPENAPTEEPPAEQQTAPSAGSEAASAASALAAVSL